LKGGKDFGGFDARHNKGANRLHSGKTMSIAKEKELLNAAWKGH